MYQIDVTRVKLLRSGGCFGYIDNRTDNAMWEILSCREEFSRILSPGAAEQMKMNLSNRLIRLHLDVLFELLVEEIKKHPGNDGSTGRIGDAATRLGERLLKSSGAEVYEAAPLLSEMERKITDNFIFGQTEFLSRFLEMREPISEKLFGGKPVTVIRSLHHWGAPKWQGRMPVGVETDAGTCYYKTRDCRIDAFYHDLVKTWFSDVLKAPSVVLGNGYGFCEEIVSDPVTDPQDAAVYVRNLGILLAVFTCLNGNDLKCSNIVPCGTSPAVIDMETLFSPLLANSESRTFTKAEQSLYSSAFSTGLFQLDFEKQKYFSILDGYGIPPDTLSVSDSEELLISGFREGYFRILRIRWELLEEIKNRGNMMIRILFGNRNRVLMVEEKTHEASYLKSRDKMEKLFSHLSYYGIVPEVKKKLLRYMAACFMEGDFPGFCAYIHNRDLYGKNHLDLIEREMLIQNPLENLQERLSRMSPEECSMNEEIIRRVAGMETKSRETIPETDYLQKIFRELMADAVPAPDGTFWWYSVSSLREGNRRICLCFLQADAAAYCSFLLQKGKPNTDEASKAAADVRGACLTAIEDKITRWETVDVNLELPAGLHQGLGGLLVDLALMERLGFTDVRDITDRLLKLLSGEDAFQSVFPGLMNGAAGLLTGLCMIPVRRDTEAESLRLRYVRATADTMFITLNQTEKKNAFIKNPDPFYGTAGMGMALTMAAKVLRGEAKAADYADTGINLFAEARAARYAEGTGLCAATAMWMCQSLTASTRPLQKCLDWAIEVSARHTEPAPDDSLFHGNSLRALFWLMAGIVMDQPSYREKAKKITEEIQRSDIRALRQFDASMLKGDLGSGIVSFLIKNEVF